MITHDDSGAHPFERSRRIRGMIRKGTITIAGNKRLKIYGTLRCASGKKMKSENRVFFGDIEEAIVMGYRPCGHCMRSVYHKWKNKNGYAI